MAMDAIDQDGDETIAYAELTQWMQEAGLWNPQAVVQKRKEAEKKKKQVDADNKRRAKLLKSGATVVAKTGQKRNTMDNPLAAPRPHSDAT